MTVSSTSTVNFSADITSQLEIKKITPRKRTEIDWFRRFAYKRERQGDVESNRSECRLLRGICNRFDYSRLTVDYSGKSFAMKIMTPPAYAQPP